MLTYSIRVVLPIVLAAPALTQRDAKQLSPRELFYHENAEGDSVPAPDQVKSAIQTSAVPAPGTSTAQNSSGQRPRRREPVPHKSNQIATGNRSGIPTVSKLQVPRVNNLGIRYNVLLVNSQSQDDETTDPDRSFNKGECLALELQANHAGYLYVFEQGSSGKWRPMFPSTELPEESNVLPPRSRVRVPRKDCFEITDPPGVERVFIVLSRRIEDLYDLSESIKAWRQEPARKQGNDQPLIAAADQLDQQIAKMHQSLASRDLKVKKISEPELSDERANAVYVVNTSPVAADRVVAEIRVNHP